MNIDIHAKSTVASIDNQLQTDPAGVALKKDKEVAKPDLVVAQAEINTSAQKEIKTSEVSRKTIEEAVGKLQDYADQYKRSLQFSIDEDSGRTIVRLLDSENKVLRQIPSEDVLSLAQSLDKHLGGLFEDQV